MADVRSDYGLQIDTGGPGGSSTRSICVTTAVLIRPAASENGCLVKGVVKTLEGTRICIVSIVRRYVPISFSLAKTMTSTIFKVLEAKVKGRISRTVHTLVS